MAKLLPIKLEGNLSESEIEELIRMLYFVSQDIDSIEVTENQLQIDYIGKEIEKVINSIIDTKNIFIKNLKEGRVIAHGGEIHNYIDTSVIFSESVITYGDGLIGFKGCAVPLFDWFDNQFKEIAQKIDAVEKMYPVLIPLSILKKTGYIRSHPQYNSFVCHFKEDMKILESAGGLDGIDIFENANIPMHALSPAACFHCFMESENLVFDKPEVITLRQSVFRNEGRESWSDFGRLRDYHVREVVFFGDNDYVLNSREEMIRSTLDFLDSIKLKYKLTTASDSFVVPTMQKYKKYQLKTENKYELSLNYSETKSLSAASFNFHDRAFTDAFNINIRKAKQNVSGCIGYGLERWVLSFLCHYGPNIKEWPHDIYSFMKNTGFKG